MNEMLKRSVINFRRLVSRTGRGSALTKISIEVAAVRVYKNASRKKNVGGIADRNWC